MKRRHEVDVETYDTGRFSLSRRPDGGFRYQGPRLEATIRPDGSVDFDTKLEGRDPIRPAYIVIGEPDAALQGGQAADGAPSCAPPVGLLGGEVTVDTSELATQAVIGDVLRTEKRYFLLATRTLREDLTEAAFVESVEQAVADVAHRLRRIWLSDRPARERRRQLFTHWDEALEAKGEPASSVERLQATAGQQVRRVVEDFVRRHLGAGTKDRYSRAELEALNQTRRSLARFEPYRSRAE